MDFHLVTAQNQSHSSKPSFYFLKKFLPLFAIALFLPFLLFFTMNSRSFNLASRADSSNDLRIWIDPSSYQMRVGETVSLRVMATTSRETDLMHSINLIIPEVEGLTVNPVNINYPQAFSGKVVLGTITVSAIRSGNYTFEIPTQAVSTGVPNAHITTSPANIEVLNR